MASRRTRRSGAGQEERFPVGLRVGGAQVEGALGKALGRGLTFQRAVRPLMIFAFDPAPEPGVEFFQAVDRVDDQAGFKIHLQGAKPAFDAFPCDQAA